jgi:hypothetical protein
VAVRFSSSKSEDFKDLGNLNVGLDMSSLEDPSSLVNGEISEETIDLTGGTTIDSCHSELSGEIKVVQYPDNILELCIAGKGHSQQHAAGVGLTQSVIKVGEPGTIVLPYLCDVFAALSLLSPTLERHWHGGIPNNAFLSKIVNKVAVYCCFLYDVLFQTTLSSLVVCVLIFYFCLYYICIRPGIGSWVGWR